jgi:Fur family peroxide stress response transcriptional regulator
MSAPALDPDALRDALEAAGWRCTPQRLAVYDQLCRADHHPTAEEVFKGVRGSIPNISLATVYKALETLVDCGLATRLTAGDASASAPARYDGRGDHHYHLRCLRSGSVRDLATPFDPLLIDRLDPELTRRLAAEGFKVTGYRLELVGFFEGDRVAGEGDGSRSEAAGSERANEA